MSKDTSVTLVPKLRFPEFRDAPAWEEKPLEYLITTVTPPKKIATTSYLCEGIFPIVDQGQSSIAGWTNDAESLIKDDLPLIVFGDHTCALKLVDQPFAQGSDGIKVIQANHLLNTNYLYQVLCFRPVVTEEYKRHFSILKTKIIAYPEKKSGEQQKIADCLSSLDELITLEAQKLAALKTHKKGLMQQLFPAEGETLPKLRFPEFRDAGAWDADELGEVAEFVNEKIPLERISLENYVSTENILQDYGGVARASKLPATGSVTRFRSNDTLVSNIRPYLKKVWVTDKDGGASNDVIVIRAKQRLLPQYFSFLLKNDAFIDYVMTGAKGVKMPRGDIGSMKEYPALYPSKAEQQKIADCLSSLDELITLEAQKLAALKTHKNGLMQQLFPALDKVGA